MIRITSPFWIVRAALRSPPETMTSYPFDLPAVRAMATGMDLAAPVTFLVGENGSGKSTILEALAIACGFNAEGGSVNLRFSTRMTHSDLHHSLAITRGGSRPKSGFFLRAESFYNVITALEDLDAEPAPAPPLMGGYTGSRGGSLHQRSHGESFWDLLVNRFRPNGLYLLDEPESALSPQRQLAAIRRIHDLTHERCQFIIATHSPLMLAYPHARILLLDERGITLTPYADLPLVQVYKGAMANPHALMRELLAPE